MSLFSSDMSEKGDNYKELTWSGTLGILFYSMKSRLYFKKWKQNKPLLFTKITHFSIIEQLKSKPKKRSVLPGESLIRKSTQREKS